MIVQVRTDKNIEGPEKLVAYVTSVVEAALERFSDRITRVEVHLSDQDGGKSDHDDKRCVMEARVKHRQPTAVSHLASTVDQAIDGAALKLARSLEHTLDQLRTAQRQR